MHYDWNFALRRTCHVMTNNSTSQRKQTSRCDKQNSLRRNKIRYNINARYDETIALRQNNHFTTTRIALRRNCVLRQNISRYDEKLAVRRNCRVTTNRVTTGISRYYEVLNIASRRIMHVTTKKRVTTENTQYDKQIAFDEHTSRCDGEFALRRQKQITSRRNINVTTNKKHVTIQQNIRVTTK